jgi:3',5'-cyclic-AMP phosphodiesterase
MNRFKKDEVVQENQGPAPPAGDGIDRRNFLGCMAWAGPGLLWSMVSGVPTSKGYKSWDGKRLGGNPDLF